jgi:hypothetical protein
MLSVAAVLAALVQAIVAYFMMRGLDHSRDQAEAARATLELSRQTAERQLRAYMGLSTMELHDGPTPWPLGIKLGFINRGQTPAMGVEVLHRMSLSPVGHGAVFAPLERPQEVSRSAVLPGDQYFVATTDAMFERAWPWEGWRRGEYELHVWGEVTYTDTFGNAQRSKFRIRSRAPLHRQFVVCEDGNDMT